MYALSIFGSLVPVAHRLRQRRLALPLDRRLGRPDPGVSWSGMLPLIVCPIVLLAASVVLYERRDLTA